MANHDSNGPGASAVPHAVRDAKDEVAAAIQRNARNLVGARSARDLRQAGDVRGVAIGLGDSTTGMAPVLTVYTARRAPDHEARAMVVDGMGVRAAGDMPMRFVQSGIVRAQGNDTRVRPAPGGFSIAHEDVTAGTLGCLARGRSAPRCDEVLLLSNNHVIANSNDAAIGDCICQPGNTDGGSCPEDQIATLDCFVEIQYNLEITNYVDCATGLCEPGMVTPKIGYLNGDDVELFTIGDQPTEATLGMQVGKSGRTTGLTRGIVTGLDWYGIVDYEDDRIALFDQQLVISGIEGNAFSAGGDSGSCIWELKGARNPVGLLFAGSGDEDEDVDVDSITIANPISFVLDELDIDLYTVE